MSLASATAEVVTPSGTAGPALATLHGELVDTTALLGFNNVIDAFHVVDSTDVSTRFFHDERQQSLRGIRFTDELLAVASDADVKEPLEAEAESRWRLVESTWHEKRSTGSF